MDLQFLKWEEFKKEYEMIGALEMGVPVSWFIKNNIDLKNDGFFGFKADIQVWFRFNENGYKDACERIYEAYKNFKENK